MDVYTVDGRDHLYQTSKKFYQFGRDDLSHLPILADELCKSTNLPNLFSGRIASWWFPLVLTGPNLPIYQIWRTSSANLPIYQIYLASAGLLRPFTVKPKGSLADAPKTGVGRFTKPSLPTLNLPR